MDAIENAETVETTQNQQKKRRFPLALKIIIPVVLALAIAVVATIFGVRATIHNREQEVLRYLEGKTFVIEPSVYDYTPDYKFLSFKNGQVAYEYWEAGSTVPQDDITQYNPCRLDMNWQEKQAYIEMYTGEYWKQLVFVDLLDDGSVENHTYSEYDNKWETCTTEQVLQRREERYHKKEEVTLQTGLTHQDIIDYLNVYYGQRGAPPIGDVEVKDEPNLGNKGAKVYSFSIPGFQNTVSVVEVDGVAKRVTAAVYGEFSVSLITAVSVMLACDPEKDVQTSLAWHDTQFKAAMKEESNISLVAEYDDNNWTYDYSIMVNQYVIATASTPDAPTMND